MSSTQLLPESTLDRAADVDVVVIGAGFSGLYMLHKLRELGFSARVLEAGDGLGGTWYWNRYPGARVDVQSIEYSYSFSEEIQEEWEWSELFSPQREIEAYINWVADKLDLRRNISLSTRVASASYDESASTWTVSTDTGEHIVSQFNIAATGCLSAPLEPDIPGLHSFAGTTLYTNRFPKEGFDFSGLRAGVIGTGSSGVQSIPVIAQQASSLVVFQRSAAYSRPSNTRPFEPGEYEGMKLDYDSIREAERKSPAGVVLSGALAVVAAGATRDILETPVAERMAAIDEYGWLAPLAWTDLQTDEQANAAAVEIYAELVRRVVHDPGVAASLVPRYPMGCKRMIVDVDYFETYNQPHVRLVDLRQGGIVAITPTGVETAQGSFDLDVLVLATGFDAMTGALRRIDFRGRDGASLADYWDEEGPVSYLGLGVAGFPNLFTVTGPGSPSVLSNMVVSIEQHVEWIADCLVHMRSTGYSSIEAEVEPSLEWVEHVRSLAEGTVRVADSCSSWYLGANVPGKKRIYMPYSGGLPAYRAKCDEVVAAGYEGFKLK
ncbi:MAG: cyclohexanone monooxygenase [Pseudonocardiales bacterium]|nr:cyclohexanone monooxygenase [Pseudonocardiales bacterium]